MDSPWQPSFNFYMARVEGKPASFVLDMNVEPQPTHPLRLEVRVPLHRPTAEGLRESSEMEPMGAVEDQLVGGLSRGLSALYVGRFITAGATHFVFYLPADKAEELGTLGKHTGTLADGYTMHWRSEADARWAFYFEFLYPDEYALQAMENRALLEQLGAHNDLLDVPREVDHFAFFDTKDEAERAAVKLRAAGYTTDEVQKEEDEEVRWGLQFHRKDALANGRADAFCAEILDLILPLGGVYDGWGSPLVKQ